MSQRSDFLHYRFYPVSNCNMCGSGSDRHKIIGTRLNQSQGLSPKKKTGIAVTVLKCRDCGLIFCNPMPVPEDIQAHYGIPPEDYWKEKYFKVDKDHFSRELTVLQKLLPITKDMKALDIGAGLGKSMIALQQAGFDAYGMEPSEPFYKRTIEKMGISPDKLKLGMLEEMSYKEGEFDFITFGAVLEHLYNPSESIKRALSWLKPGGIIHIEVPSSRHLIGKLINLYYRIRGTNYVTNTSPMHTPFHLYEFDLKSFLRLGSRHHFQVAEKEYFVCDIMFFPAFLKPLLSGYMKMTNTGMQLIVWLRKAK